MDGPVLRFLGSGETCADYLTVMAAPGLEDAVAGQVSQWLSETASHDWDLLHWDAVVPDMTLRWIATAREPRAVIEPGNGIARTPGRPLCRSAGRIMSRPCRSRAGVAFAISSNEPSTPAGLCVERLLTTTNWTRPGDPLRSAPAPASEPRPTGLLFVGGIHELSPRGLPPVLVARTAAADLDRAGRTTSRRRVQPDRRTNHLLLSERFPP